MSVSLPDHPRPLCFPNTVLLEDDFSVDDFVGSCKRRVSIDTLRSDLESYFKTLKNSMVELINHDYADFLKLSSNLIGVDNAISDLLTPLGQLREELLSLKLSLNTAIRSMEGRLVHRAELREKKSLLNNLLSVTESVAMLERLLRLHEPTLTVDPSRSEEFSGLVQDRIGSEFSRLQYLMSLSNRHPVIKSLEPRIRSIEKVMESNLEKMFVASVIDGGDPDKLSKCLRTYASISKQQIAEELFSKKVVLPYMEEVFTIQNFTANDQDISMLYAEVLCFIPSHCHLLLCAINDIHHVRSSQQGYDFLVNAVFPEVVRVVETRLSTIFAPGNPELFYKNYKKTTDFISQFEEFCSSKESIQRLRSHVSYLSFINKWSFPVYYQIRFQEIAGQLESVLSSACEPAVQDDGRPCFKLKSFAVTWQCVRRCWEDGVFINPLIHRFWKLSVQLLTRLAVWLEADEVAILTVLECAAAISDCCLINDLLNDLYRRIIEDKIPQNITGRGLFFDGLAESAARLLSAIPCLKRSIVQTVTKQCYQNLEPTHTIPRLYRRTNKEVPSKPSAYVVTILKPLQSLLSEEVLLGDDHRTDICTEVLTIISERYLGIISDVLLSVKRTEDSLKKLKQRGRRSQDAVGTANAGDISDDDKIRLQLSLDVEAFVAQVDLLPLQQLSVTRSISLQQLLEVAANAKEIAMNTAGCDIIKN